MEALQVDREAHHVPLAARLGLAAETEAAKAEHFFDPPERRARRSLSAGDSGPSRPSLASRAAMRWVASWAGLGVAAGLPSRPREMYAVIWRVSRV